MIVAHGGLPCVCGRRGCWERYASGTALNRLARERGRRGSGAVGCSNRPEAIRSQ